MPSNPWFQHRRLSRRRNPKPGYLGHPWHLNPGEQRMIKEPALEAARVAS
jgi:hypothetical protein